MVLLCFGMGRKQVVVEVEESLWEGLRAEAAKRGRFLRVEVEAAIREYLRRTTGEQPEADRRMAEEGKLVTNESDAVYFLDHEGVRRDPPLPTEQPVRELRYDDSEFTKLNPLYRPPLSRPVAQPKAGEEKAISRKTVSKEALLAAVEGVAPGVSGFGRKKR